MHYRQSRAQLLVSLLIILLVTLPSMTPWYYPPYQGFYPDMIVGMLASLLTVYLLLQSERFEISLISLGFIVFAFYLPLQAILLKTPYLGNSLYISGFFVLMAMLCSAILSVRKSILKHITFSLLWGIFLLASLQFIIYTIQLSISDFSVRESLDWILFSGNGGQVGQRNNFSHILMWGVVVSIILQRMGRLNSLLMWLSILGFALAMAHSGSRSVLVYILGLGIMASCQIFLAKEQRSKQFSGSVLIAVGVVLLIQFTLPLLLEFLPIANTETGIDRVIVGGAYLVRLLEWQKAWFAFLDSPLLGHGWGSYGFQSFWRHDAVAVQGMIRENSYFAHCHNLLLQLLAEIGLLGTLLILLPITFFLLKAFKSAISDYITFGLLMLCAISLLHSMVEFPLWNSNFLIVFFLVFFVILARTDQSLLKVYTKFNRKITEARGNRYFRLSAIIPIISLITIVFILIDHERQVGKAVNQGQDMSAAQAVAIGEQGNYILFFESYADWLKISNINPGIENRQQMQASATLLLNNMQVFPYYTHMAAHTVYLQKMGRKQEARIWLDKIALYYPRVLPGMIHLTQVHPEGLADLQKEIVKKCNEVLVSNMYGLKSDDCKVK